MQLARLTHNDGEQIQRSLFDYVEDEAHNEYERAVALALDRDENVLWWYRNLIGDDQFAIQGYRRHRIRPEFIMLRHRPNVKHATAWSCSKVKVST